MMLKTSAGAALILMAGVVAAAIPGTRSDLIVHEWGTFTTVAGENGRAEWWRPLDGASDLPCFVERARLPPKPSLITTVRMETPVIYFYGTAPVTVSVGVSFEQGLLTEFFPRASATRGATRLEWNRVRVTPGASADFSVEDGPSHYYAARAADAAPLQAGGQKEGFLFYRGVGGFELPLTAIVRSSMNVDVANNGPDPVRALMLFENRGGRIGFGTSTGLTSRITMARPMLNGDAAAVRAALMRMLVAEGLYAKEAAAMVETWGDSWLEEGARIFYLVPTRLVDATLPLQIKPAPAQTTRVFVGRLELGTPEVLANLKSALLASDPTRFAARGRFVEPFSRRLLQGNLAAGERAAIDATVARVVAKAAQARTTTCAATTEVSARSSR